MKCSTFLSLCLQTFIKHTCFPLKRKFWSWASITVIGYPFSCAHCCISPISPLGSCVVLCFWDNTMQALCLRLTDIFSLHCSGLLLLSTNIRIVLWTVLCCNNSDYQNTGTEGSHPQSFFVNNKKTFTGEITVVVPLRKPFVCFSISK